MSGKTYPKLGFDDTKLYAGRFTPLISQDFSAAQANFGGPAFTESKDAIFGD